MARPIKNTADYFPHDTDMRNDPKIKALRRKYGIEGYGIYCMAIEYIGDSEHFVADIGALGLELMAGDFDCDPDKLIEVLRYCESIDLFQIESGDLTCKSLENRLSGLLSKRERDRNELSTAETQKNIVIASESTQSKVKESKVKESIEENIWAIAKISFDEIYIEKLKLGKAYPGIDIDAQLLQFLEKVRGAPGDYLTHDTAGFRKAFAYQLRNAKQSGPPKKSTEQFLNEALK